MNPSYVKACSLYFIYKLFKYLTFLINYGQVWARLRTISLFWIFILLAVHGGLAPPTIGSTFTVNYGVQHYRYGYFVSEKHTVKLLHIRGVSSWSGTDFKNLWLIPELWQFFFFHLSSNMVWGGLPILNLSRKKCAAGSSASIVVSSDNSVHLQMNKLNIIFKRRWF